MANWTKLTQADTLERCDWPSNPEICFQGGVTAGKSKKSGETYVYCGYQNMPFDNGKQNFP